MVENGKKGRTFTAILLITKAGARAGVRPKTIEGGSNPGGGKSNEPQQKIKNRSHLYTGSARGLGECCACPAQAEQLHFTGTNCAYPQSPPERSWVSDDGILHQRGMGMISINVADTNYATGIMIVNGNIDLDLATGDAHTYGTLTIYPDAYNGTFEGNWTSHISDGSLRGTAVAHGTGDLEGMQFFVDLSGESPLTNPCTNGNGTILIP